MQQISLMAALDGIKPLLFVYDKHNCYKQNVTFKFSKYSCILTKSTLNPFLIVHKQNVIITFSKYSCKHNFV